MKAIEKALGVTGKELARISGVSDATIYRIEGRIKSEAGISEKLLFGLCEKTGVDAAWLLDMSPESLGESLDSGDISAMLDSLDPEDALILPKVRFLLLNYDGGVPVTTTTVGLKRKGINKGTAGYISEYEKGGEKGLSTPAKRLKSLRLELGLTQKEFAKSIDITQSNLASIEVGRSRLTKQIAMKIEERYEHAGAEWILAGNELNKDYPVGEKMIEWLREHPKARQKIWDWMNGPEAEEIVKEDCRRR